MKPTYGRDRQNRYERLRDGGLTKEESRQLSRVSHPDDLRIIRAMLTTRRKLIGQFEKNSAANQWTEGERHYRFHKGLRRWYESHGYDTVMAWFHYQENRSARQRGWVKGSYDPANPDKERVRRRTKRDTPVGGKGRVKAQRARAKLRKYAILHGGKATRPNQLINLRRMLRDAPDSKKPQIREWMRQIENNTKFLPK